MESRYDTNPFAEPETDQVNPFSQSELQPLPSAKNMDTYIPPGGKDMRTREKELDAREERLDKWEKELKKREAVLAKTTLHLEPRNFPPFFPIIHHDIAGDMPDYLRFRARLALASWIGILVALFWNIVALTAAWVIIDKVPNQNDGSLFGTWILLAVYVVAGWFGSYVLWYRPLYRALRRESAGRYIWFFLFYMVHIGFCIYAAIAPKIYFKVNALTGFISTMALNDAGYPKAAIFYGVGTALYTMETLVSIYLLNSIFMYFRGIGKAADMKRTANLRPPAV